MVVHPVSHGVSRVPRYSGSRLPVFIFRYRALTFCGRLSHAVLLISSGHDVCPQPRRTCVPRFGLLRVRSPLLAESRLMSFPGPTSMFQFRPFPSYAYLIQRTMLKYCLSGFPHSEIHGYNGYLLLPVAYRSLSRPSSAPDAKAFPLRSFQLDLSNHLLILKVELCRQFNRIFEIVIVTHLYDVPQLKLKIRSSVLSNKRPLCCLAYHFFITLFSFQGSIFQLLLQPDLKICLTPGLQIQRQMSLVWWARVGSNHRPYDYQSYALAS